MRDEAPVRLDRGRYQHAVTPWDDDEWRRDARAWVADCIAAHGLRTAGEPTVRLRPWSVLVRVPVEGAGRVWFKANPPGSRFEGTLTAALARRAPDHVLRPLAVDAARGWSLLPDGGELFRDALALRPVAPDAWEALLRQYATMQRRLAPHTRQFEELGVPGARTAELPALFDELVERGTAPGREDRRRFAELRPRLADWCAELAAAGVEDGLDHGDLHEGQVFHRDLARFTVFDWGDAAIAHPFMSLQVPVARACERHGPEVGARLRDVYLEPWTADGATGRELRRAVRLAWRLSALRRACSWLRLFPGAADATGRAQSAERLRELFAEPPL
ncbi:phosphotransferase [Streptomyces mangrovisoli]|uniref:Phosphotransferase n=1 Tax=Streptomyces mangrovisoli TaxID=1428628 RepID=A0A1J4NYT5_9ACTN|nr:phosphotransferase [Streptomyces mangrovisoli]OIJ66405.1 phosphotransferase [Streptomyces mangrovisoli]